MDYNRQDFGDSPADAAVWGRGACEDKEAACLRQSDPERYGHFVGDCSDIAQANACESFGWAMAAKRCCP